MPKDLRKTHYQNLFITLGDGREIKVSIPAQIISGDVIKEVKVTGAVPLPEGTRFEEIEEE